MTQLRFVAAVLFILSLGAVGCGGAKGNNKDGGTGGGTTGTGGGTTGTGGGTTGTGGGGTTGTGGGGTTPTTGQEAEVAPAQTNDDFGVAEPIAIGQLITGTIGAYDTANTDPDDDTYTFDATEGEVYRITLEGQASSTFQPTAMIQNADESYVREVVNVGGAPTDPATREFYIPRTGTYFLKISDIRNIDEQNPGTEGGPTLTYQVKLSKETLAPSAVTLPVTRQMGTFPADGKVQAFSFNSAGNEVVHAEVVASNLSMPSDLDPSLYCVDNTASPTVLGAVEDNDFLDVDATLSVATNASGSYYCVVDFSAVYGPARNFEVSFSSVAAKSGEVCGTAIPLAAAGMVTGDTSTLLNTFDVAIGGTKVCTDVFDDGAPYNLPGPNLVYAITIPAGQTLSATVTPTGTWDSAVAIVSDCTKAAASCLAGGDQGLEDEVDTTTYLNSGAQPMQVFIIVDSWAATQMGAFTLTTTLQ